MTFSKIIKITGLIVFIVLAGYGVIVSFYELSPDQARPRVVIPLDNLNISFNTPTSDQNAAGGGVFSSSGSPSRGTQNTNSNNNGLNANISFASQNSETATNSVAGVSYTGDISKLSFGERGMEDALPEELKGKALQASIAKSLGKGDGDISEVVQKVPKVDCKKDAEEIEKYLLSSTMAQSDEGIFKKAYRLKQEDKLEDLENFIRNTKQRFSRIARVNPPESMFFYHRLKVTLFDQFIGELEEIKNAPEGRELREIYTQKEAETHAFVIALLRKATESICETCGI